MKKRIKKIYHENKKAFAIWSYLWIMSNDKGEVNFSLTEISTTLKMPVSTVSFLIKKYATAEIDKKQWVDFQKINGKQFLITFSPTAKKKTNTKIVTLYDELYDWLKEYYSKIDYDYPNLKDHKRYVKTICEKLKKSMQAKNAEITDQTLAASFKILMTEMPDWWKESNNLTLTIISKHYTKIINQIKSKTNGKKIGDSYSKAKANADQIDFSKLTQPKTTSA